jgi:transposase
VTSASTTPTDTIVLPEEPPGGLTAGVDWARDDHAISVVDDRGRRVARCAVTHTAGGLGELVAFLGRHGAVEVAIERPDGPVVDSLLAAGMTVVMISPNQVKNLRGRYGSAGNKDHRFDAYVLADTLRTDRGRLRPLVPDTEATVALRRTCRARKDLVNHLVAVANQLRAHLRKVLPAVVGLFADLDSAISLAFLTRFDTEDKINWLAPKRLGDWLSKQGYSGRVDPTVLHQRPFDAPRGATGEHATSQAVITAGYVALLHTLVAQIKALSAQIDAHADAHIFTCLPRAGHVRAARLLAEIGDCRARFPIPESLTLSGRRSTLDRQSGKSRIIGFRWACDKQLRDAVTDFAADTPRTNPWAADLYRRARARGHDHPHAVRILVRAWLHIIWHCWQDHLAYDPTQHRALQRILTQNEAA